MRAHRTMAGGRSSDKLSCVTSVFYVGLQRNRSVKVTTTRFNSSAHGPSTSPSRILRLLCIVFSVILSGLLLFTIAGHVELPISRAIADVFVFLVLDLTFAYLVYRSTTINNEFSPDRSNFYWARQLPVVSGARMVAISPQRLLLFLGAYAPLRFAGECLRLGAASGVQPGGLAPRIGAVGWISAVPSNMPVAAMSRSPENSSAYSPVRSGPDEYGSAVGPGSPKKSQRFLSDPGSVGFLALAVLLNVVIMLVILLRYNNLPDTLVLHWNSRGAPDRFGSPRQIWIIPIITWLVTIGNFGLAWAVASVDRFASRFLLAATLAVELMALIALYMLMH